MSDIHPNDNSTLSSNAIKIPKVPSTPVPPIPKRSSSKSSQRDFQSASIDNDSKSVSLSGAILTESPTAVSATDSMKKESRSVSFSRDSSKRRSKTRSQSRRKAPILPSGRQSSKSDGDILNTTKEIIQEKAPDLFAPLSEPSRRQRSLSRGRRSTRDSERKPSSKNQNVSNNDKELPNAPDDKENQPIQEPIQEKVKTPFDHIGKTIQDFKDHIMKITIHAADALESNLYIRHPLVRISFIDMNTGKLLFKSAHDRKITCFNESKDLNVILPVMTHVYNFTEHNTKRPEWEENVLFNEDYLYLLQDNVVVTFEILDFITSNKRLSGFTDGWYKIAWGFIKLMGGDQLVNTESKVRLQLYKYPFFHPSNNNPNKISPFYNLIRGKRVKYPSTLYVTLKGVPKMEDRQVKTRSRLPTEIEVGRVTLEQLLKGKQFGKSTDNLSRSLLNLGNKKLWRYERGLKYQIPNQLLYYFDSGSRGAFSCSFSNNGLYLSIACIGVKSYPIKVYDVLTGERVATLEGHQDLVYKMNWSPDDSDMISASSDSSVRIWSFEANGSVYHTGTLAHPTFVYSAIFHPTYTRDKRIVATAAYDGLIRIWSYTQKKGKPEILQTLKGHSGYINTMVFDDEGSRIYSADSTGLIKLWDTTTESIDTQIHCCGTVDIFMGIPIHSLSLHTNKRKLLVHTASNTLHILDTRILRVLTHIDPLPIPIGKRGLGQLNPLPNPSLYKRSEISPCGTLILSGSFVYNLDSGKKVGVYALNGIPVDVIWHPKDFTVCIVEYGSSGVHVFTFDDKKPALAVPESIQSKSSKSTTTLVTLNEAVKPSSKVKKSMELLDEAVSNAIQGFKNQTEKPLSTLDTFQGTFARQVGI